MQDEYECIADTLAARERRVNAGRIKKRLDDRLREKHKEELAERLEAKAQHELAVARYAEYEFRRDPITDVPDEVKLPTDYLEDVQQKVEYNNFYADYYMQRFLDTNKQKYENLSYNVRNCHKSWFGDHYKKSGYFNVKRVFHCHNRWCWICTHLQQAKRLYEYTILFEKLLKDYDLYHVVFTVRNVKGDVLKETIDKMSDGLKKIIRYFQGRGKIAGIDFLQYGFVGAIRSFEIVINSTDYHPHMHCLFMLKKGLEFPRTEVNAFSFDHGVLRRTFSKLEVMLQKIFYLVMNGKKVTLENIQTVSLGYSCTMDYVEGTAWHEVFKYATKMSKDGAAICTYEQFKLLDDIFHRMKFLQCYGEFYNNKDDTPEEIDPYAEILFEKVLILLNKKEQPERDIAMALDKLVDEVHNKKLTVISKKLSYKYLQSIVESLREESQVPEDWAPF